MSLCRFQLVRDISILNAISIGKNRDILISNIFPIPSFFSQLHIKHNVAFPSDILSLWLNSAQLLYAKPLTKCSLWLMFILVNNTRQSGVFSVDNFITVNPSSCRFSFP